MARAVDLDKAIEIIEGKQKELCPVGRYGRNYVYGSDREKYDAWKEIIDALENLPALNPQNEWVSVDKKLPQCGVPVLIGNPHWDYPVVANYAGSGVWMDSWHQKMTFTPTCWMPLPERPKEDE